MSDETTETKSAGTTKAQTNGVSKPALAIANPARVDELREGAVRAYADKPSSNTARIPMVYDLRHVSGTWLEHLLWVEREAKEATGAKFVYYAPKSCTATVFAILRFDPRWQGVIGRDDFLESTVIHSPPPWHECEGKGSTEGEWCDDDTTRLRAWLDRAYGVCPTDRDSESVIASAATANRSHPVRAYLDSLTWDGTDRLSSWLAVHCGVEVSEYAAEIGARWMISAVARAYEPGCQVDCTIILEGPQGYRKTSALRALVPVSSWYADTGINLGDKDSFQNLRGIWIYGLDELDSLRKGDVTKVKNFLSQTKDRYRPSYAKRAREFLRQNVFAGTTNEKEYLVDGTGNRRFWPIRIGRVVDVEGIVRERDQLWAEAAHRYRSKAAWYVDTPELRAMCEAQQAARMQSDPWEDVIAEWLDKPTEEGGVPFTLTHGGVLTREVLTHAIRMRTSDITRGEEMRVAAILRGLGWDRPLRTAHSDRGRRFYRADDAHPSSAPAHDSDPEIAPEPPPWFEGD